MRTRAAVLGLALVVLLPMGVRAEPQPLPDSQALNLGFENKGEDGSPLPSGWRTGSKGYEVSLDAETKHEGEVSLQIRATAPTSTAPTSTSFGAVTNSVPPSAVAGKRIRYSGWIRRAHVDGYVGLWFRAEDSGKPIAFDNMQSRSLEGTHDWELVHLELDVPADADRVLFGALLGGGGTMWVDELRLEILGSAANPIPEVMIAGAGGLVFFLGLLFFFKRRKSSISSLKAFVYAAGGAIAVVGVLVAAVAPGSWFDFAIARLIGSGGSADTTTSQRVIAIAGALIAAISLVRWGGHSKGALPITNGWRLWVAAVPFAALLAQNLRYAGASFHLWAWPHRLPEIAMTLTSALLVVGCVFVISQPAARSGPPTRRHLRFATGCGAGYGCFSALWHCCPPLWQLPSWPGPIDAAIWLLALTLSLGAVGRVSARWSAPKGELFGALLFACFYPWHTPAWFAQCLIAGAFSTLMVRLTGSGWAPALFLGTAYVTHMTLPFLGWGGAAIAVSIMVAHAVAALPPPSRRSATGAALSAAQT